MPRESRRTYQIGNLSQEELNFILQQISDRLDELEGYTGTPTLKSSINMDSNRITTLGSATAGSDALRQDQADEDTTSLQAQITSHVGDTDNPHEVTHAQLSDKGTYDHVAIDTHIASVANPHGTTLEQARGAGGTFSGTVQWLDGSGQVIHEFK